MEYLFFLYDVKKEFGAKGQVNVKASFDVYEYRGSLTPMRMENHLV